MRLRQRLHARPSHLRQRPASPGEANWACTTVEKETLRVTGIPGAMASPLPPGAPALLTSTQRTGPGQALPAGGTATARALLVSGHGVPGGPERHPSRPPPARLSPGHAHTRSGAAERVRRSPSSWCWAYLSRERWCAAVSTSRSTGMSRSFLHRPASLSDSSWWATALCKWHFPGEGTRSTSHSAEGLLSLKGRLSSWGRPRQTVGDVLVKRPGLQPASGRARERAAALGNEAG
jgi:hypothetical protein